jgi:uncharacterized protein
MNAAWSTEALWLLTGGAAFAAGVLNAIAGGGSFLTFPALVFAGVPPLAANATSAMAVSPGYLGSTWGFRSELQALPRALIQREVIVAAVGGVIGAGLLLVTPARIFTGLVPFFLLPALFWPNVTQAKVTPPGACLACWGWPFTAATSTEDWEFCSWRCTH